jgi:hypothetical protein
LVFQDGWFFRIGFALGLFWLLVFWILDFLVFSGSGFLVFLDVDLFGFSDLDVKRFIPLTDQRWHKKFSPETAFR